MKTRSLAFSVVAILAVSAAHAGPGEDLSFAVGVCSTQPDAAARLACYDRIAAQLKAGMPVTASARPQAAPVAQAAPPAYTPPAYTPPVTAAAPTYTPPVVAPAPVYTTAQRPAYTPPPAAAPKEDSSWYDPTSWFGSDDAPQNTTDTPAEFGAERIPAGKPVAGAAPKPEPLDHITAAVASVVIGADGRFVVTLDNGQVWRQSQGDSGTARFRNNGRNVVTISRGFMGSYNLVLKGQTALFKVKRIK